MAEKTTSVQIVLPQHCKGYAKPRLFGGQLLAWIDIIGAVAARRYAKEIVTTVRVDNLNFVKPAFLNDTIVQEAYVVWTGRTSLEVRVNSYVEEIDGTLSLINRAFLVYVAIDGDGRPTPVPPFEPQTTEEIIDYAEAQKRNRRRRGLPD